jgi:carboxylesterase 2
MGLKSAVKATLVAIALFDTTEAALYDNPSKIKDGYVQGYPALNDSTVTKFSNWQDVTVWKGIPFAASTVSNNCWKALQPAAK